MPASPRFEENLGHTLVISDIREIYLYAEVDVTENCTG